MAGDWSVLSELLCSDVTQAEGLCGWCEGGEGSVQLQDVLENKERYGLACPL